MSILLVGGDRLGNIVKRLKENGFDDIEHISGRKTKARKIKIPDKTDLVLVLVDFVEHELTEMIKRQSRKCGVRIAFSKRSWAHMEGSIQENVREIMNAKRNCV
ncbi:DUF2325 domain-containing protein [Clostridium fermenticellae]|uniref:DUF2325 domain-containing protein n=1 Tax=Clostridium fermenticellae TaxID=2068654 RepID=A0A386H5H4_9CLOT|nr:DUF2325 domain-containing protein [Clostridium fermenticellae]AYD40864.1 DUF2325 domain-containing protein [Clostridium fermenticellae]